MLCGGRPTGVSTTVRAAALLSSLAIHQVSATPRHPGDVCYAARVDGSDLLANVLSLLRRTPYGFLISHAGDGGVSARLVQHLAVEDDGRTWIGTSPRSRKVQEIDMNPEVAYACEDRTSFAYVSLVGRARLVDDDDQRVARWNDGLATFFPDGPTGGDFVLVEVVPRRIEIMDFARAVHPEPLGLVPAVLVRRGHGWEPE
jgi:general stress protein 26